MEKKLEVIIVEDERKARELMEMDLNDIESVKVMGTFRSTAEADEYIQEYPVDIIFLDINMPHQTGLQFLEQIRERGVYTSVVMVSAEATFENAQKAISLGVKAFIDKPWDINKLEDAIEKIKHELEESKDQFVIFKSGHKKMKFNLLDIAYFVSEGNYCWLNLSQGFKHLITQSLKEIENIIGESIEIKRVDRFHIINLAKIKSFDKTKSRVEFEGDKLSGLDLSKGGRDFIMAELKNI
jgi:two-component system response regulator LytT